MNEFRVLVDLFLAVAAVAAPILALVRLIEKPGGTTAAALGSRPRALTVRLQEPDVLPWVSRTSVARAH